MRCKSLAAFVREAWHILEPITPLVWSWHLDAICLHLEALTLGKFEMLGLPPRLLVNVPPGSMKSLLLSVMWQAWEWGPMAMPHLRYLCASYNGEPSIRDARKCRDLMMSDWYQRHWPIHFTRKGESSWANDATGDREVAAFASLTSKRGDRLTIDDPHSVEGAESAVDRAKAVRRFREGGMNRLNDQVRSVIVIIMQRLHTDDLSGMVMKELGDYVHLNLPMEFEADRRCVTPFFTDPRTKDGELLDPKRFPPAAVAEFKKMGQYAYAGQYQQRPSPREGGLFKRSWFADKILRVAPLSVRWVRHWDLAGTKDGGDRTAGVKLGKAADGRFIVAHVVKAQEEGAEVRKLVKSTAETDGKSVMVSMNKDPGQAGKEQAADYGLFLAGWIVRFTTESGQGDKYARAEPFSVQCELGNVYLVEGPWNEAYIDELCDFPNGSFDDQVDASAGAFGTLLTQSTMVHVPPIVVRGMAPHMAPPVIGD